MDPQNWTGFDRRKICPRCGGYQTRFGRFDISETSERPWGALRLLAALVFVLQIGIVVLLGNKGSGLDPTMVIGLIFTVILVLGVFIAFRIARRGRNSFGPAIRKRFHPDEPNSDSAPEASNGGSSPVIYFLSCDACGYRWQKTAHEWEREGHQDVEDLLDHPPAPATTDPAMREDPGNTEAMLPSQARKILIITGVVIVFLLVSSVVLGMLLQRTPLGPDSAFIIMNGGVLVVLLILIGIGFFKKVKPASLILLVLILVIAIVLWLLLR